MDDATRPEHDDAPPSPQNLPGAERPVVALAQRLRRDRAISLWLVLRIALPFPLSGAVLAGSAVLVSAPVSGPYEAWMRLCAAAGITLGLGALVGLLLARAPRARRLTLWLAGTAVALLLVAYLIGADPFCWRGRLQGSSCSVP